MYLKDIKYFVDIKLNDSFEHNTDLFIKSHRACEGYFNRIIFIGLRLKGLKYDHAQNIIKTTFIKVGQSLKKGLKFIHDTKGEEIYKNIENIYNLFLDYSVPYRNKIEHAVIPEIKDNDVLKLCISININLLKEIEHNLKSTFDKSCFNEPNKWGAKRTSKDISEDAIKELKLGGKTKEPIEYQKAKEIFNKIKWGYNL